MGGPNLWLALFCIGHIGQSYPRPAIREVSQCGLVTSFGDIYLDDIDVGTGLLPDGTRPLPKLVLTCYKNVSSHSAESNCTRCAHELKSNSKAQQSLSGIPTVLVYCIFTMVCRCDETLRYSVQ